jgi:hypothetical protein
MNPDGFYRAESQCQGRGHDDDTADVHIKRRDDDITMKAVVGVFLRAPEYFNGLLLLTASRIDDIDEAIVSRCIALIKFNPPDAEARRRIWRVMLDQFGLSADPPLLEVLVGTFPDATGRDIKGLAKLVAKYCHHKKVPPAPDVFKRCAMFRGIDLGDAVTVVPPFRREPFLSQTRQVGKPTGEATKKPVRQ